MKRQGMTYTYPSHVDPVNRSGKRLAILNHDAFLFQEKDGDFSYQHNSRGLYQFIGGNYDLREVSQRNKVIGLLMMAAAIQGIEAVAWIEHTSNWDGFIEFTTKDGLVWCTTWMDFELVREGEPINPMEPRELWPLDNEEFFEGITLRLNGGYLPSTDDYNWSDEEVKDLDLNEVIEVHVWFDT